MHVKHRTTLLVCRKNFFSPSRIPSTEGSKAQKPSRIPSREILEACFSVFDVEALFSFLLRERFFFSAGGEDYNKREREFFGRESGGEIFLINFGRDSKERHVARYRIL